MRFLRSCSSALPPQLMREAEARYGVPMIEAYGMTEATHQMTSNPLPPGGRVPGSVGVSAGAEVRIVDASGTDVRAGASGEVAIRGPGVTPGYLNNPDANATAFFDGWFRTGDEGVLEDGYLRLRGRLKEMIIRGGENISPYEIEAVLQAHPQVSARRWCSASTTSKYGQIVEAAVVLHGEATPDELRRHARKSLAAFKVPERVHVLDEIPKTATGRCSARGCPRSSRAAASEVRRAGRGGDRRLRRGRLARGGADVTLIARGEHLRAMVEHGVRVHSPRGDFEARPAATSEIEAIADADVVVLGLKSYSLRQLAPGSASCCGRGAVVFAAQNGIPWWYFQGLRGALAGRVVESVDPGGVVSRSIARERVVGCVVYCSTEIAEPGVIRHIEGTRFSIGRPGGGPDDTCRAISEAFVAGGLKCPVDDDLRPQIWLKLVGNAAFNPITTVTRATLGGLAASPHAVALARR